MHHSTLILAGLLLGTCAFAQNDYQEIAIPMRDGETLAADLFLPDNENAFPTILIQTPYNKNIFRIGLPLNVGIDLGASPYAFVVLDWRCFFASTGACSLEASRGEDGYDAVEWIAAQPWSNGKVATWGPSALGIVQFQTAREQPPHLTCAVPLVASPQTLYHNYYPGGVALASHIETLSFLFGGGISLIGQNPYYNLLWQIAEDATWYPDEIDIPMAQIGGWFDHNTEDVLRWYHALREESPAADDQWLLMGPWTHGGTGLSAVGTAVQGELDFPEAAGEHNVFANAFLAHYLLEEDNGFTEGEHLQYFQMGDNAWAATDAFPPDNSETATLFLNPDGGMAMEIPEDGMLTWSYDPQDPSPTIGGKTLSLGLDQGPYDQSADVESRDDNVIFTGPVLTEDLVVQGQITALLHISSDRPDTDIALRLTEVYPDGRSIALGQIIQRMRFREGYTMPAETFMEPGEVYQIRMEFDNLANTFKAGNRLRLIVSSSNYPHFNRNMNTGGEMYPNNNLDTLVNPVVAQNGLHVGAMYASRLELPVSQGPSAVFSGSESRALRCIPNPVSNVLRIEGLPGNGVGYIYNTAGQHVMSLSQVDDLMQLNVSGLVPGVYVISLRSAEGAYVGRFVKN